MNDPHVESLLYAFEAPKPSDQFTKAAPLDADIGRFAVRLEGGRLVARPKDHYATEEEAREALEPYLRNWEIDARLQRPPHWIAFAFLESAIVDRAPLRPALLVRLPPARIPVTGGPITVVFENRQYPAPDHRFTATALVEALTELLERARTDESRLLYDAYGVYTAVVGPHEKDVARAARRLRVSREILRTLARISNKNDPRIRRKYQPGPVAPVTDRERAWLDAAMALLIRRVGHVELGPSDPIIALSDLPPLT